MLPEPLAEPVSRARLSGGGERLGNRLFSFPAVLITGLVIVTVFTVSKRFYDPDLWWQLRVGQIIATTRSIPATDLFSFTALGSPWTAHEWLAQLSMYLAYDAGGSQGLMLWLCGFASLIFVLVYGLCWLHTGDALTSFFGGIFAWFFATVGLAVRALILGHLFLVMEMLLLELGRRKNRRWLWCLPPLFALWANCHGSYVFGMAVLGIYWVSSWVNGGWGLIKSNEQWDKAGRSTLGVMLLLCAGALCCNPVGIRLLFYPLDTVFRLFHQSSSVTVVDEWLPPAMNSPRALGMLATIVGVLVFSVARRSELYVRELLLVLIVVVMAVQHQRMLFLFGIVASPVVCRLLASVIGRGGVRRERPAANAVLVFAGLVAMVSAFPTATALQNQVRQKCPVAAVDYVRRQGLSGPMLNDYEFGGYLIWAMPEHKVFIDGRADVYDWVGVFAEYSRWALLVDTPTKLLDKYHVRFCLLRKGTPATLIMTYLPGWKKTYADDLAEVFER